MANLAQIIPALFVGPGGQQLTQEQIRERQQMAQDLLAQATDTSPNAGGVASILAKGVAGFRAGMDRNAADNALKANAGTNQSLIAGLLGGTGGWGQTATAATPTVAPMQNVAPASIPQTADAAMIRQGLVDRGLPSHVADAFVVNFKDESGLNPGINEANPVVPGSRGGFGLYQLTGPRRTAYESFAAQRGVDPSDVDAQLDFLKYELDGPEAKAAQSILSAPDTATAAQAIVNNFLRPAPENRERRAASYARLGNQAPADGGIEAALASSGQFAFPPAPSAQQSGGVNPAIIAALSNPAANEQTRSVATSLLNNQMSQQQAAQERASARDNWVFQQDYQAQQQANDPLRQLQIQEAQRKLAQSPNADENFYGNPVAVQNPDGSIAYGQIGNRGTFKPIQLGEGQQFAPPTRTIDAGTETIMVDQAGNVISRTPKNNRTAAAETAGGTVEGRVAAERATSASGDIQAGQNALDILNQIEKHPGLDLGTGATSLANRVPGTTGYDFQNIVEQAKSGAFLAAIQQMRGLGALSNTEGAAATSAVTRMDTATSKDAFLKALSDYRKIVQQGIDRAKTNSKAPADTESQQQPAQKRLKFNPATGMLE